MDFDDILGNFTKQRRTVNIEAGKLHLVTGAVQAAKADRTRTNSEKARLIADLFHVSAADVETLLA